MQDSILVSKRTELVSARFPAKVPVLLQSAYLYYSGQNATSYKMWQYSHLKKGIRMTPSSAATLYI